MVGGFGISLSGLQSQMQRLATAAGNVANVNTTGFKASKTVQSSIPARSGGGVQTRTTQLVRQPGFLQQTPNNTDLAISGDGFFPVETPGGGLQFTRAGDFQRDAQGDLTNSSGRRLQGFRLDDSGNPAAPHNAASLEPVNIAATANAGQATTQVELNLNLDADEPVGGSGPDFTRAVTAFDSLGNEQQVNLEFTRTSVAPNEFNLDITDGSGNTLASETLTFDGNGALTSSETVTASNVDFGDGGTPQDITFDLGGITQQSGGYNVNAITQNGTGSGDLTGVSISEDGIVSVQFSNGRSADLYEVPVATFGNPDGLRAQNGQAFTATDESGPVNLNRSGAGGSGTIQSARLETSNVSLTQEIAGQIQTRIAFQANLAAIQAQDEQFESLLDIKA